MVRRRKISDVVWLIENPGYHVRGHSRCELFVAPFCFDEQEAPLPQRLYPSLLDEGMSDEIGVACRALQAFLDSRDIQEGHIIPFKLQDKLCLVSG